MSTLWSIGNDYAIRFNDIDLVHKAFWTAYGIFFSFILMSTHDGPHGEAATEFCFVSSVLCLIIGGMNYRCRIVDKARDTAVFNYRLCSLMAATWVCAAVTAGTAREAFWVSAVLLEPCGFSRSSRPSRRFLSEQESSLTHPSKE